MYEWVLFANVVVYLVILAYYLRSPCISAFHPATFYAAVHGFVFVVRPIFAWYGHYTKVYTVYGFMPTQDVKITSIGVVALAYCVVMLSLMHWAPKPVTTVEIPSDIRERLKKPILATFALLSPIALYALLRSWANRAYDTDTMVTTASGYRVNTSGVGYLTEAPNMLIPLTLMLAWAFRFRPVAMIPFAIFVVLKAGSGGRGTFVIGAAAMGLLYLYEHRRKWPTPRIMGLFAIALVLFTIVGADRGRGIRGYFIKNQVEETQPRVVEDRSLLDGMDYANMEYTEYMVRAVPELTHTYGYFLDNLQILTEPIPRALWQDKPVGPPIKMWNLRDYGNAMGITVSVGGNGWSNLGWIGVILYSLFTGFCLAKCYNLFLRYRYAPLVVIGYFGFLAGTILYLRDGALITVFRSQLFNIAPLFLVYLLSRRVHRRVRLLGILGPAAYKAQLARKLQELRERKRNAALAGLRGGARPLPVDPATP
ncbi:O-antigen polymerase [Novosphingobium sp. Leaf2]|uniref:O-antigen polymerase n=1 Tax=Novosphingobium sp. Leaf2 TaxID=1735670 RepID=UPI0006FF22F0|nr:O-antigen polymerase [Novosphingobium sp. Leaf2]KQM14716.1 hypothetical protein ASE49_11110 [Novosphingobium sp. Leaf2]